MLLTISISRGRYLKSFHDESYQHSFKLISTYRLSALSFFSDFSPLLLFFLLFFDPFFPLVSSPPSVSSSSIISTGADVNTSTGNGVGATGTGIEVGGLVGRRVGCLVGAGVGGLVGFGVGDGVDSIVGPGVGAAVLALGSGQAVHPQGVATKGGRNPQLSSGIEPVSPAISRIPQGTVGWPGNSKIPSALETYRFSPQTEHPFDGIDVQIEGKAEGTGTGVDPAVGSGVGSRVGA